MEKKVLKIKETISYHNFLQSHSICDLLERKYTKLIFVKIEK